MLKIILPVGSSLLVVAAFPAGNGEKLFSGYKKQRIPRHKYADREMFSAGFSFLDGLQDLILIAAAIDNAKDNDIRFLLIDQVIGNNRL